MKVRVKLANTAKEIDAILRLRHAVYVEEEHYMNARPEGYLVDRFDAFPGTFQVVALVDTHVVGAARVTLDGGAGMPCDDFFDHRNEFPDGRLSSGSMLCVQRSHRCADVVFSLMAMAYYRAAEAGATHMFTPANPEQAAFFMRAGFRPLGEEQIHPVKKLPFVPMVLDLRRLSDPFLRFIRAQRIESMMSSFDRLFLGAGETLFALGDSGQEAYVLVEGRLKVHVPRRNGDDIQVAEIGPGELVGELTLLTGHPRTATVEAITDTQLMAINSDAFDAACQDRSTMRKLIRLLSARLTSTLDVVARDLPLPSRRDRPGAEISDDGMSR